MGIQVLGPLAVDGSGRLGPRDRVVLQALAVRQGRTVTSDELTDALWGDAPPASAHKNLQSCIVRLRKALGADAIETTDTGYRLAAPAGDVDAQRFEAEVARARELLALGEADRVSFLLERALRLWRGPAFPELADWAPARHEASIYRWDTDLDRAIDFACQMAGRDLTPAEWEQYLPAQPYRSVCPQE